MNLDSLFSFFRNRFRQQHALAIYTDGSHKGKWGAWAFVVVANEKIIFENAGRERKTDSHRMEFQAAIEALQYLKPQQMAHIYSDSRVLIQFVSANKKPISNPDQLEQLTNLLSARKISWHWIKAHSGIPYNERCDQLCIQAREGLPVSNAILY